MRGKPDIFNGDVDQRAAPGRRAARFGSGDGKEDRFKRLFCGARRGTGLIWRNFYAMCLRRHAQVVDCLNYHQKEMNMALTHNPAHPGEMLREYLPEAASGTRADMEMQDGYDSWLARQMRQPRVMPITA